MNQRTNQKLLLQNASVCPFQQIVHLFFSFFFIHKSINLESGGLFSEWIQHARDSSASVVTFLCELAAVFLKDMGRVGFVAVPAAHKGFLSAQTRVHQSVLDAAEDVRTKIAQLPEETSTDSNADSSNSSSFNTGWLVKACHDCVAQVQILLERSLSSLAKCNSAPTATDLKTLHAQFHQRIDVLLRMVHTIDNLLSYLESADLNQIKFCVAGLEVQSKAYTQQMGDCVEVSLGDLSFAASMVHKIIAERRRMTLLRRGRDINYDPVPARLLASPSRKRVLPYDDAAGSENPSPESVIFVSVIFCISKYVAS